MANKSGQCSGICVTIAVDITLDQVLDHKYTCTVVISDTHELSFRKSRFKECMKK